MLNSSHMMYMLCLPADTIFVLNLINLGRLDDNQTGCYMLYAILRLDFDETNETINNFETIHRDIFLLYNKDINDLKRVMCVVGKGTTHKHI